MEKKINFIEENDFIKKKNDEYDHSHNLDFCLKYFPNLHRTRDGSSGKNVFCFVFYETKVPRL